MIAQRLEEKKERLRKVFERYGYEVLEECSSKKGKNRPLQNIEALLDEIGRRFGEDILLKFLEHKGFMVSLIDHPNAVAYVAHSGMLERLLDTISKASLKISKMSQEERNKKGLRHLENPDVLFTTFITFLCDLEFDSWERVVETCAGDPEKIIQAYEKGAEERKNPLSYF